VGQIENSKKIKDSKKIKNSKKVENSKKIGNPKKIEDSKGIKKFAAICSAGLLAFILKHIYIHRQGSSHLVIRHSILIISMLPRHFTEKETTSNGSTNTTCARCPSPITDI
jgi:hypothetical protein